MTRVNALRNIAGTSDSVAWGNRNLSKNLVSATRGNVAWGNLAWGNLNAIVFAAVLIACSMAVGCSSEQPKPVVSNNQIPVPATPSPTATTPTPAVQAENKPAPKKVVHKKPTTVNYTDKTYGVTFEYPRRYAIETGNAAAELVMSNPVPMNFVQPGSVALAAVELPETGYANTDFSSAFFNVSVHKTLTADQCTEFSVPQPKQAPVSSLTSEANSTPAAVTSVSSASESQTAAAQTPQAAATTQESNTTVASSGLDKAGSDKPVSDKATSDKPATSTQTVSDAQGSQLSLSDMKLRGTEAVSGEGTRQSDSKYFHVFQNGSCYEFALNVTTVASQDGMMKHVDRDRVFSQLEKIMNTVKINAIVAPETTAEAPAAPAVPGTPAQ
jgi:hypothetical protein